MEMDPLQLEESTDAAAALMCKAPASVSAALQPPTPYKTDQTLENDLISECIRLDAPSVEKNYPVQEQPQRASSNGISSRKDIWYSAYRR